MMHEKKRKETRFEANTSPETKKEQQNKEKIKLHFTCWESNVPSLPQLPRHATPLTATHRHISKLSSPISHLRPQP
jgi:hypothetical protein